MNKVIISSEGVKDMSDVKIMWSNYNTFKSVTYYPVSFTVNNNSVKLSFRFKGETQVASMDASKFGKAQLTLKKKDSAVYEFLEKAVNIIIEAINEYDPNRTINSPIQTKTKEDIELEDPLVRIPIKFDGKTEFYLKDHGGAKPELFELNMDNMKQKLKVFSKHSGIITLDSICKSNFGYSIIPKLEIDVVEPREEKPEFTLEDVLQEGNE